jgi:hypothetical protein
MNDAANIIGSFADERACARCIERLRQMKTIAVRVFSPIPSHEIDHAIGKPKSPVRAVVLAGGILGVLTAMAITIGTSWEWNLVVGGKPIVSWPPFIIIMFELMVLFGGISAVLSFMVGARVPDFDPDPEFSSRFSEDRFGIVARCTESELSVVESILREAGAEEVVREA